jgi:hypothetical protein
MFANLSPPTKGQKSNVDIKSEELLTDNTKDTIRIDGGETVKSTDTFLDKSSELERIYPSIICSIDHLAISLSPNDLTLSLE